jgi:hypothetical protein
LAVYWWMYIAVWSDAVMTSVWAWNAASIAGAYGLRVALGAGVLLGCMMLRVVAEWCWRSEVGV